MAGNFFDQFDNQPVGPVFGPPPSRSKQRAEARADRSEERADRTSSFSIMDANRDDERTDRKNRLELPQSLRKEFSALPEVRAYSTAAQQLAQALNTGAGPQADLALTYAFAKAMDPDSVVRDQEQNMVIESQPWFQARVEEAKKQFGMNSAGVFAPEARAALRQQIIRSVATRRPLYERQRGDFSETARKNGLDPTEVVGAHVGEAYRAQARAYDQQRRRAGATLSDTGTGVGGMVGGMLSPPPRKSRAPKADESGWWGSAGHPSDIEDIIRRNLGNR